MTFAYLWGKCPVHNVPSHNAFVSWNVGGCPEAIVHSTHPLKKIPYNYLHCTLHNAIVFGKYTKACSDRIVPFLGLMATEHLRCPNQHGKHFRYHQMDTLFHLYSSQHIPWSLHLSQHCCYPWCTPRHVGGGGRRNAPCMWGKSKLHPPKSTLLLLYWVPIHLSMQHLHVSISRRGPC